MGVDFVRVDLVGLTPLFRPYISSLVYISGTDIHTITNAHLQNPWQLLQPCIGDQNNFESLACEATAISPCSLQLHHKGFGE